MPESNVIPDSPEVLKQKLIVAQELASRLNIVLNNLVKYCESESVDGDEQIRFLLLDAKQGSEYTLNALTSALEQINESG
jgi:hypothetical protein